MSCAPGIANFRLLDANIGWGQDSSKNLAGFDSADGVCLAQIVAGAVDPNQILPYLPPARLARARECEWYLVTPSPPESLLLHRDGCCHSWHRVWESAWSPEALQDAVAVATWRSWLGVAERGASRARIWGQRGRRLLAEIRVSMPGPIAFTARGELLVTSANSPRIGRYGPDGEPRGFLNATLPQTGKAIIIAADAKDGVWIVLEQSSCWTLWRAAREDSAFASASVADLQAAFTRTGLLAASANGFCFDEAPRHGLDVKTCFSWYGRPLQPGDFRPLQPPLRETQGQMITKLLDSGIPRCEWHRIRIDADIPAGTALSLAVATTEDQNPKNQGDLLRNPAWKDFPAGAPHPSDWTSPPSGSVDFLIDQPAGRYLFLRLRLTGSGTATPRVRRIRIDFPRVTSLDHLPVVYRENPKAEDFTKRFLALFDASIADVDEIITRYPALLDPTGVPDQLLPWLGGCFDIVFDPSWDAAKRRSILQIAPQLYRQRGTLAGLGLAIQTVFGVTPSIEECSAIGPWGALAAKNNGKVCQCHSSSAPIVVRRPARLRSVRLFGRSRARFRLNQSSLGVARLRSHGDPDQDAFASGAYRFRVLVPPMIDRSQEQMERLTNLIKSQSPAHTVPFVRVGGTGFLLGSWSMVGVDTAFVPVAAPVLGSNVQLNRMSVLWSGPSGTAPGTVLGRNSVIGTQIFAG
jgi:phage tail-like protein